MTNRCCPFLDPKRGCRIAIEKKMCRKGDGWCVVVMERCCNVLVSIDGTRYPEWETCSFYMKAKGVRE